MKGKTRCPYCFIIMFFLSLAQNSFKALITPKRSIETSSFQSSGVHNDSQRRVKPLGG